MYRMWIAPIVGTALFLASTEASADTITVQQPIFLPVQSATSNGFNLRLPGFNGSLGVLTSATLQVRGFIEPGAARLVPVSGVEALPTSVTLTPGLFLFPLADGDAVTSRRLDFDQQVRPVVEGTVRGASRIQVDFSVPYAVPFAIADSRDREPLTPLQFSASTRATPIGSGSFNQRLYFDTEPTTFSGTLSLEYNFIAVPEPVSLAVLAIGLVGLAVSRRKDSVRAD